MSKKILSIALSAVLLLALYGCGGETLSSHTTNSATASASASASAAATTNDATATNVDTEGIDLTVTDRDNDPSYNELTACKIVFTSSGAKVTGSGATANGTVVTITAEGTYLISGSCSDGQIIVNAPDDAKVQLVLNGLSLASASCPLLITAADKVFLTLAKGTENTLSDASDYTLTADDSTVDAAIFSKADLTINGTGSLTVNGNYKHGIVSKDDLIVTGGTVSITSVKVGMEGKDCVKLTGGDLTITSGTDGIRSTNTEDTTRGFVYLGGAALTITSTTDGIQAETLVCVSGGTADITTGGGSGNSSSSNSTASGWGSWGGGQPGNTTSTEDSDSASAKGIKSTNDIQIVGGTITIDSSDDSIHAGDSILVSGGDISLASGDDGIHSDLTLTVQGGSITISQSYEGLEAAEITVSGGTTYVTSRDDGLNAAGGNDQSSVDGRPGQNGFSESGSQTILISGGYLVVNASGDGIDSNGTIEVTGGITLVSGPTDDGNGAVDYGASASISGGIFLAVGSSGMAESFSEDSTQGSILVNISSQSAGTPIALCDSDGKVLVSFTPMKQYVNVVVSTPEISAGDTYTLCTGTVSGGDEYGYATGTSLTGSSALTSVTMTSLHYGESTGMGNPGGGPGR